MTAFNHLFGKSILSDELKAFLKKFKIPDNPELPSNTKVNYYDIYTKNEQNGITLNFDGYYSFTFTYGEPVHRYEGSFAELFLKEIELKQNYDKLNKPPYELPFSLQYGDKDQTILKKIGKKPKEKCSTNYGYYLLFELEDITLEARLNMESELFSLTIRMMSLEEKKKTRIQQQLRGQDKKINLANIEKITKFAGQLPTKAWRKRQKEGDDNFTEPAIKAVELILNNYTSLLIEKVKQGKATQVYTSVKKVVMDLNKVNDKYESLIETLERDELADYLNKLVRLSGLDIDQTIDLTEDWRQW
jgi:hypothetical protein